MGLINWRGAGQGLGEATERIGNQQHLSALMQIRDQNLAQLQAERDARQHKYGLEQDENRARLTRETHKANTETDIENIPRRGAAETEVQVDREGRMNPVRAEGQKLSRKAQIDADLEAAPQINQAAADRERVVGKAKADTERESQVARGKDPEYLRSVEAETKAKNPFEQKRIELEGARLDLSRKQFNLAKQKADIEIESGTIDRDKKRRLDALEQQIVNEKDPEKVDELVSRYYTVLGKDSVKMQRQINAEGQAYDIPISARTGQPIKQKSSHPSGGVARPTTRAEFDALPKGARFINPADGMEMIKR
jgi:hypothetical protein